MRLNLPTRTSVKINLSPTQRNHVDRDVSIYGAQSEPQINGWVSYQLMGHLIYRYDRSMAPEKHTLSRAMYRGMKGCHFPFEVPVSNVSISFDKSAGIARIYEQFEMAEEPGKSADRINFLFSEAHKPNGCEWFLHTM